MGNRRASVGAAAALVNGTLIQSFELDDVHRQGVLHVGAVTLPPLLAVTEIRPGLSGRDLLRAAVAGYEIGPRVGKCMGPQHIGQGWHSGATVGVFSAVSGAAAALRLSSEQAVHALGIAGTQSAGLTAAQYGAMVKRMHADDRRKAGFTRRCWRKPASPASSTFSSRPMAASARPSRARMTASISTSYPGSSAASGRRCACR